MNSTETITCIVCTCQSLGKTVQSYDEGPANQLFDWCLNVISISKHLLCANVKIMIFVNTSFCFLVFFHCEYHCWSLFIA